MALSVDQPSFDKDLFCLLNEVEERHFWFGARRRRIWEVVAACLDGVSTTSLPFLEIGCGTGNIVASLRQAGVANVGGDLFIEALRLAQAKSPGPFVQMDGEQLPFRDESFQLVGTFDLIEHLQEPQTLLRETYRVLVPGGYLIVTVPAYAHLWSYFDELSHHQRRYGKGQLAKTITAAGFELTRLVYWFALLYPVVWLGRRLNFASRTREGQMFELQVTPIVNQIASLVLELERILARRVALPFGTSLVAVGQKGWRTGSDGELSDE